MHGLHVRPAGAPVIRPGRHRVNAPGRLNAAAQAGAGRPVLLDPAWVRTPSVAVIMRGPKPAFWDRQPEPPQVT